MDSAEASQLCAKLRELINREPGKDDDALRDALSIVNTLQWASTPFLSSRLTAISQQLRRWFSTRRWREVGDPAGLRTRDWLMEDVTVVQKCWIDKQGAGEPGSS